MPGGVLPPLSVIFSWPNPNYINPQTRGWGPVIGAILLASISSTVLCARLWARIRLRIMGIDDAIIIAAMVPAIGMTVLICLAQRRFGFDHHVWDNPIQLSVESRKVVLALEATYILATGLIKISILLFYRRLVSGSVSKGFVWAIRASIFSVIAYIITFENTLIFGCRPINAYWNEVNPIWRGLNEGKFKCLSEVGALYAANITSIVQDFLTFLMPLLLFWKLHLPIRQKVVLGCIFGLGFFLCIVGIIRILCTKNLYFNTYDVTWESESMWIWTSIEMHGAVICASAPALKLFFERYLKVGSTQDSTLVKSGVSTIGGGKMLRSAEDGSFAMVSQRSASETQSGGSTYTRGRTNPDLEAPPYTEKIEIEEWDGYGTCNAPVSTPCPAHFRSTDQWRQRNRAVYNASSCSWYND